MSFLTKRSSIKYFLALTTAFGMIVTFQNCGEGGFDSPSSSIEDSGDDQTLNSNATASNSNNSEQEPRNVSDPLPYCIHNRDRVNEGEFVYSSTHLPGDLENCLHKKGTCTYNESLHLFEMKFTESTGPCRMEREPAPNYCLYEGQKIQIGEAIQIPGDPNHYCSHYAVKCVLDSSSNIPKTERILPSCPPPPIDPPPPPTTCEVQGRKFNIGEKIEFKEGNCITSFECVLDSSSNRPQARPLTPVCFVVDPAMPCHIAGVSLLDGNSIITYKQSEVLASGNPSTNCIAEVRRCTNGNLSGSFNNLSCTLKYKTIIPLFCSSSDIFSGWTGLQNSAVQNWYRTMSNVSQLDNRCADFAGMEYWSYIAKKEGEGASKIAFENSIKSLTSHSNLCFSGDTYIANTEFCKRVYTNKEVTNLPPRPNYSVLRDSICKPDSSIARPDLQQKIIDVFTSANQISANRCPEREGLEYWVKDAEKDGIAAVEKRIKDIFASNPNAVNSGLNSLCLPMDKYSVLEPLKARCLSNGKW